jgi:hypothetical protein
MVVLGRWPIAAPDTDPVRLTRVSDIRKDPRVTLGLAAPVDTISCIVKIL